MRRFIILFLLFFILSFPAYAQFDNVGTSVANFLKIGVGSRAEAMGGAFVAQVDDITALYWNISGMANMGKREIMFSQTDWILDIYLSYLGIGIPLGESGAIGISIYVMNMGEIEQTTETYPDGSGIMFDAGDVAVGLAYARRLTDRFSVGIQAKYIREQVAFSSAQAVAIDIGTQYITGLRGMKIGMAISNFGTKMRLMGREQLVDVDIAPNLGSNPEVTGRLDTKAWPLPLSFSLGISMDVINNENFRFTGNMDYRDPRDLNPLYIAGGEISWSETVFLRGGFKVRTLGDNYQLLPGENRSEGLFTVGAGAVIPIPKTSYNLNIDYSYTDLGKWLKSSNRFSLAFKF